MAEGLMWREDSRKKWLCRCTTQANKATTNITQGHTNKALSSHMLITLGVVPCSRGGRKTGIHLESVPVPSCMSNHCVLEDAMVGGSSSHVDHTQLNKEYKALLAVLGVISNHRVPGYACGSR